MALARARRDGGMNYWPGFVDALSTLILGIIFLLSVLLSLEKTGKLSLEEQLAQIRSSLAAAEGERERYKGLYDGIGSGAAAAQGKVNEISGQLDAEKRLSARALAQ